MSRLRDLALKPEDLAWLPRLVNMRLLVVSDQALLDARARQPVFILLPTGETRCVEPGRPAERAAATFYKLLLLSVRSLPLAPEACLLRHHEMWLAGGRGCEPDRGVTVTRTGAILTPRHPGLMITDHALQSPAAGGRRTVFSLLRGAPDAVLAQCRWVWQPGKESGSQVRPLAEPDKGPILAMTHDLMARCYLPVALAIRYQVGASSGKGFPAGEDPRPDGRLRPLSGRGEGGKAAVYLGMMAFDNPLLTGVEKILDFFRSRGVVVLWDSRLPFPLQRAIAASGLHSLVLTGEPPSRPPGGARPLTYAGRNLTEAVAVCREWEVARVQAFPDGSGQLQPLGARDAGQLPGRLVPVPAPPREGSLLARLQELYLLAEQAIVAGVKSN